MERFFINLFSVLMLYVKAHLFIIYDKILYSDIQGDFFKDIWSFDILLRHDWKNYVLVGMEFYFDALVTLSKFRFTIFYSNLTFFYMIIYMDTEFIKKAFECNWFHFLQYYNRTRWGISAERLKDVEIEGAWRMNKLLLLR